MPGFRPNRTLLTITLIVGLLFVLMIATSQERIQPSVIESLLFEITSPVAKGLSTVSGSVNNFVNIFKTYHELQQENKRLHAQVEELSRQVDVLKEFGLENQRLRKLLGFKEETKQDYRLLAAKVISRSPSNWQNRLLIDRGSQDGVAKDMPIVTGQGLVGRVVAVSPHSSQVLLITDRDGAVGALVQESRSPGIIEGLNDGTGLVKMIRLPHDAQVMPGNMVLTSGLSDIYPKGLRIGTVLEVNLESNGLMKNAIVKPFVDFNRLEEVFVITADLIKGK